MKKRIYKIIICCFIFFIVLISCGDLNKGNGHNEDTNSIEKIDIVELTEEEKLKEEEKRKEEEHKALLKERREKTILVNKEHSLPEDYNIDDLVRPNVRANKTINLKKEAANELEKMFIDGKSEGYKLLLVSGYRSHEHQITVFNRSMKVNGNEHTSEYVAKPGHSEHEMGLAADVLSSRYTTLTQGFEDTKEAKWMHENMHKYGYILRYPKGKENITGYSYEPWHIRYVGIEVATEIYENNLTLEEYLGY